MITAEEAYMSMRGKTEDPYIPIMECDEYYTLYRDGNGFITIDKESGVNGYLWMNEYFNLVETGGLSLVFLDRIFSDLLDLYKLDMSENNLAWIYAKSWNALQTYITPRERIIGAEAETFTSYLYKWIEMEAYFRAKIETILEQEDVDYAPGIDKDDPFYRFKPFMVRNGYTVSMNSLTWEKI